METSSSQFRLLLYFFIHIIVPVLGGITIYALWRGIYFIDPQQTSLPLFNSGILPNWVKYNLPDGLWLYAYTSLMIFIWKRKLDLQALIWVSSGFVISVLAEFGQKEGLLPGTFDWKDLFAYFIAIALCVFHFPQVVQYLLLKTKISKQ